jgi:integrase
VRISTSSRAGYWRARYYDPSGQRHSRTFPTKTEARRFLAKMEADKARGEWRDPRGPRTGFEPWAMRWLDGNKGNIRRSSWVRDETYVRRHILPTFGSGPLGAITPLHVQQWVNELRDSGLAPATVRECHRIMGGVMTAAVHTDLIRQSPCVGIKLPPRNGTEPRFLSMAEVHRLEGAMPEPYRVLVTTAVHLGCRWSELAGLKRDRIDWLTRPPQVHIVATLEEVGGKLAFVEKTKTKAGRRTLALNDVVLDAFARHLERAPASEYVFTSPKGSNLYRSTFRQRVWEPAVERAGLAPLRFHDLRHTCASLLIDAGTEAKDVQEHLGHSSVYTTLNIYTHLFKRRKVAVAEAMQRAHEEAVAALDGTRMGHNEASTVARLPS